MNAPATYIAFLGSKRITSGSLPEVIRETKAHLDANPGDPELLLIFHEQTGKQVDFDFRGSVQDVVDRAVPKPARMGPGRPRLGVISREVSLLPRHWEWLETQPNGASAALRRLVDEARKQDSGSSQIRAAIDATGRVMTAMAGNLPGFEEAYRALYARDRAAFDSLVTNWPDDVRSYVLSRFDQALV